MIIWREITAETAVKVTEVLNAVFLERRPVDKLLNFLLRTAERDAFSVRVTYRSGGNRIVEQHHCMTERGRISTLEVVFKYDM